MITPKDLADDGSSSSFSFELDRKTNEYNKTNKVLKVHDELMSKAAKKFKEEVDDEVI